MPKEYIVEIIAKDPTTNEIIARSQSFSFSGAEEELGKMERRIEKMEEEVPEEVKEEMESND